MFPSIHLGFADIPTYSTIFLAGFFIAIVIARKIAGRYRLAKEDVLYGAIYAAIGILIGSKLLYCLTRLPSLIQKMCIRDRSMVGHLLGAAGGVEAITCVKSIMENYVHANIGLVNQDPECDLDCPKEAVETKVDVALSNSLGFGGHNAVLIFKAFAE